MVESSETDFQVEMQWEPYDTQLYSAKLMRHTQRHETRFSHKGEPGSLLSDFAIGILANGGYDIIVNHAKYLRRRRKLAREAGRLAPPPRISIHIENTIEALTDITFETDVSVEQSDESGLNIDIRIEDDEDVERLKEVVEILEEYED